jgi:hypothetical protein
VHNCTLVLVGGVLRTESRFMAGLLVVKPSVGGAQTLVVFWLAFSAIALRNLAMSACEALVHAQSHSSPFCAG